jgi:hypothetical protein
MFLLCGILSGCFDLVGRCVLRFACLCVRSANNWVHTDIVLRVSCQAPGWESAAARSDNASSSSLPSEWTRVGLRSGCSQDLVFLTWPLQLLEFSATEARVAYLQSTGVVSIFEGIFKDLLSPYGIVWKIWTVLTKCCYRCRKKWLRAGFSSGSVWRNMVSVIF